MPSQCGPSFYSYGHRLTLVGDNSGALPLAPARALSSPHPIRHRNHIFKTITQPVGVGAGVNVCVRVYNFVCASLLLRVRFVSLECEHAPWAYVCGSIHPVGKAAVSVCVRAYLCVL